MSVGNEPQDFHVDQTSDKLTITPWMQDKLHEIENLKSGSKLTFDLPPEVDHLFFITNLGIPQRDNEFGGLFNPSTRSMIILRESSPGAGDFDTSVAFLTPRLNADGKTTDDIFFHTHPWNNNSAISYYQEPKNSCRPSDQDTSNAMALQLIEEEDGFKRTVISIVSSRGFISVTEARGIRLDEASLKDLGVTNNQVLEIKRVLSFSPPEWIKNYAEDEEAGAHLVEEVENYYHSRRTDPGSSNLEKLQLLTGKIRPLVKDERQLNKLVGQIGSHFPKYPKIYQLEQLGLTNEQALGIEQMLGISISMFQLTQDGTFLKVE